MDRSSNPAGHHGNIPPGGYRLSLVIPAWNEAATIRQAIAEAVAALTAVTTEYEVIIVDDGSTDSTAELVRDEASRNGKVRLIQQPRNLGYGAALRAGFVGATLDHVAFTDADCQFDLGELEYMLPLTKRYDIVCGYRIDRQDPARRRFFSWGYNTLVTILMGSPVHDLDCALKVFRRDKLQNILPESNNFLVNTEMLTRARHQGMAIVEVGVHHRPRAAGESKVSLWDIPKTLSSLLPFWWSQSLFPGRLGPAKHEPRWHFWFGFAVLGLLAFLVLFLNLSYPLLEPDEGRYAEIGREMVVSGDWIMPTLDNEPYLDKPPMLYWLIAASFELFGISEQSARFVPAGAAFLTVLGTYVFVRRCIGWRVAFLTALAIITSLGFVICGRTLILDSLLTLFVTIAFFTAYEAIRQERFRWGWWTASALCCGLGILTKGPIACVLLMPPLVAFGWLNRLAARPGFRGWTAYFALALAVAAPWFVAMSLRMPEFVQQFLVDHHFKRFFTNAYHDRPFWYYVPVLLLAGMPWTLLLPSLLRFLGSRSPAVGAVRHPALGFALLWAGWGVLFFSLSNGKLPPYVLPMVPALTLIIGGYLEQLLFSVSLADFFQRVRANLPRHAVVTLACVWIGINVAAWLMGLLSEKQTTVAVLQIAVCLAMAIGVAVRGRQVALRGNLAWCGVLVLGIVYAAFHVTMPAWARHRTPVPLGPEATKLLENGDVAVACYGREWGSLHFYLSDGNRVRNFSKRSPHALKEFLARHPRCILIVKQGQELESLRWALPPDMHMTKAADRGEARIILIRPACRPVTRLGGTVATVNP